MVPVKCVLFLLYFNSSLNIVQAAKRKNLENKFNVTVGPATHGTYYLTTERPVVQLMDPKYTLFFNITSLRYGRRNPMYYVSIHLTTLLVADNNLSFDMYFYEHTYNQYRRSFLEFHFKWCNLFRDDQFFAGGLRKTLPAKCPHPAGTYHLYNLTLNVDAIPEAFPFTRGRLLVNASYRGNPAASVYADLELKKYKKLKP